jgi:diguanylate cyclase (GGDEF)-like protein
MTMLSRSPLRPGSACGGKRCRGSTCGLALGIDLAALDALMPFHVIVALDDTILHAGPTIHRLREGAALTGAPFQAHFELRRPNGVAGMADLARQGEGQLRLTLRDAERTAMKGRAVPLGCGRALLLDLSFGISVVEAVGRYRLTSADFAATDIVTETLFLVEAQAAALNESKKLNRRLQSARLAAEHEAATDRLTGLKNRRAMEHVLGRLLGQGVPFGLIHADLDHFKQINDTHGHAAGDAVLREVARRFRDCVRTRDTVARIGGDEFVLLLHGLSNPTRLADLASRMEEAFAVPVPFRDDLLEVSVSLGVTATGFYDRPDAATMLADADAALYQSKRAGRGRYSLAATRDLRS